jgi:beta-lactamase class A
LPIKAAGLIFGLLIVCLLFGVYHVGEHGLQLAAKPKSKPKPAAAQQVPEPQPDAALNQLIAAWAGQHSFISSVVVTELTGSLRTAAYNQASSVVPASTYKIYVAWAVLHGIEQGDYTLSTKTDDGSTIQADLQKMILNSDNDAARTLGFLYGWKNINALLQSQGIRSTDMYNYVPPSTLPVGNKHTTAADLATTLQKLYAGQLLNTTHTQWLLQLLKTQHYRERIPAGVPSGVAVADKPGWLSPADGENGYTENDAAIVYGPKSTYILVITTTGSTTQPLTDLSRQVYAYLEEG